MQELIYWSMYLVHRFLLRVPLSLFLFLFLSHLHTHTHTHTHSLSLCLQAPHCLQEATLDQAVTVALSSPLKDVVSNAELSRTQLETLTQLGGLVHQGKDLYDEIKEVRNNTEMQWLSSLVPSLGDEAND